MELTEKNLERIKKINKDLIKPNGSMKSFQEQLLEYEYGLYPKNSPLVISTHSSIIDVHQLELNDLPIVINQSTIRKIKEKHDIDKGYLIQINDILTENVLVLQSKQYDNSLLFITEEKDNDGHFIINSMRKDKMNAYVAVNEINSVYGKRNIENLIQATYEQDLKIYPNKKTEHWLLSLGFQFAQDVNNVLLTTYDMPYIQKSQVENALKSKIKDITKLSPESTNIEVEGHIGTWYVVDTKVIDSIKYFLLEHEEYGDETACIIVDSDSKLVLDDVWNGFDDLEEYFNNREIPISVQSDNKKPLFDVMEFSEGQWEQIKLGWDNDLDVSAYANPALSVEEMKEIRIGLGNNIPLSEPPLEEHSLFGIEKADWTALQEFEEIKGDSKLTSEMREQIFLEKGKDAYAIYQLKDGAELRDYRFEGMDWIESKGLCVERENYNLVYTDTFSKFSGTRDRIEELWDRFNNDHPADFTGHSLSVSDIVAIKQNGVVSYHYCDSFDFVELPKFAERLPDSYLTGEKIDTPRGSFHLTTMTREQMEQAGYGIHHTSSDGTYHIMGNGTRAFAIQNEDNPLRTAELSTEQNYNMIDGIINNEPSVLEKIKALGTQSDKEVSQDKLARTEKEPTKERS